MKFFLYALLSLSVLAACQTIEPEPDAESKAKSAEIHYQLGIEAIRLNHLPKAFEELDTAYNLAPERSDILDATGLAWRLRGDLDKAEDYYRKALRHNPGPATYNNYGNLLLQKKKWKKAEKNFRRALDFPTYRNPDTAYINLGDSLLGQNKFNEAISAYRQASLLNKHQTESRLREAEAFILYHRHEFALAVYEKLLGEQPAHRLAMEGMIKLLIKSGRQREAMNHLEHFVDVSSDPMDKAWAKELLHKLRR